MKLSGQRSFKVGSGCYTCIECGKLTRETGDGESTVDMCNACYYNAEYTNAHNDGEHDGEPCPECHICNA